MLSFVLLLCLLVLLALVYCLDQRHDSLPELAAAPSKTLRLLKPRTPNDCPACRAQTTVPLALSVTAATPPPPWRELKSRRGRPKTVATNGFACPNKSCAYYNIVDQAIHALVGDGYHGKNERIQTFRCQACITTFSARRDTPLYRLKTPSATIGQVLGALAEGLDVAATARVFRFREQTIACWLVRAAEHMQLLHEQRLQGLHLSHIQLDEIRTRLRLREKIHWLWVAIDPQTKLIPVLHLGGRTQADAHQVVHLLKRHLAPTCLPVFTSDGLNHYFYALTAHFGHWIVAADAHKAAWQVCGELVYGQVQKIVRRRKLVMVKQVMRLGTFEQLKEQLQQLGFSGRLNTAYIERVNLSIRRGVAALARQTWATAQTPEHLLAQAALWRGYYHFVRVNEGLRLAITDQQVQQCQRYRQRTPAQAAGLTKRRWSMVELLSLPLYQAA